MHDKNLSAIRPKQNYTSIFLKRQNLLDDSDHEAKLDIHKTSESAHFFSPLLNPFKSSVKFRMGKSIQE